MVYFHSRITIYYVFLNDDSLAKLSVFIHVCTSMNIFTLVLLHVVFTLFLF